MMIRKMLEDCDCSDRRAWRQALMDALGWLRLGTRELSNIMDVREGMIHSWLNLRNLPDQRSRERIRDLLVWICLVREQGWNQE